MKSSILWVGWPLLGVIVTVQTLNMFGKILKRYRGYQA
jgi:biofilm PGA synthesis N-glycosyltransferase PgaC